MNCQCQLLQLFHNANCNDPLQKKFTTEIHSMTVTEWLAQIKRHFTFFACNK